MSDEFKNKRLEICKKCLLYKKDAFYGDICDKNKYMSPDGTKVSYFAKPGWINGCGCALRFKAAAPNSKCKVGKW